MFASSDTGGEEGIFGREGKMMNYYSIL